MQLLGPALNGMYEYECLFKTFSGRKLSGLKTLASNFQYFCFRCRPPKSRMNSVPSGIMTSSVLFVRKKNRFSIKYNIILYLYKEPTDFYLLFHNPSDKWHRRKKS